jgi:parallel beta-helix repeat protein
MIKKDDEKPYNRLTNGSTLYVGGSGPGNYSSIQYAIDAASDGDTVFVYDDSSPYYENIVLDKTINLVGEDKDTTIINGGGSGDVVYVSANQVKIQGFTIKIQWPNKVSNCSTFLNERHCIYLYLSSENSISECNIISNQWEGIYMHRSSQNSISNCNFLNNEHGIQIHVSFYNFISNCNFLNNKYGIYLLGSDRTSISNCNLSNNWQGIRLVGVTWISTENNTVSNCNLSNNEHGIELVGPRVSNNIVSNCHLLSNNQYGIILNASTNNNLIYHNKFIDNNQNAYDVSTNRWDNGFSSGGNYWDNYIGTDRNGDGIGDTPYDIAGGNNQDRYPLGYFHPIANFTYSPSPPSDVDVIHFTDTSVDPDGTIISWKWDFGDGNTSTLQNPTHRYADDGIYTITLNVTDDNGATDETSRNITVLNIPPVANFEHSPLKQTNPHTIQFIDLSHDPDGKITKWKWDFGDGNTSTLQNPTHRYANKGSYTVTLNVTDNDGATNEITHQIPVYKMFHHEPIRKGYIIKLLIYLLNLINQKRPATTASQ